MYNTKCTTWHEGARLNSVRRDVHGFAQFAFDGLGLAIVREHTRFDVQTQPADVVALSHRDEGAAAASK